jgi:prophage regulatory protein
MISSSVRVIDSRSLKQFVPYSRTHIRRLEKAGQFPLRVQLGPNRVGWVLEEVEQWIRKKVDQRGGNFH